MSLHNYTTTMHAFLEEMATWFPDYQPVRDYTMDDDPRASASQLVAALQPFSDDISHGNTSVYDRNTISIGHGLDIRDLWSLATDSQKESIHAYVRALFIMASTIVAFPDTVLETIDSLAQAYVSGNVSLQTLMQTDLQGVDEGAMADLCRLMLPTMEMDSLAPKKMSP